MSSKSINKKNLSSKFETKQVSNESGGSDEQECICNAEDSKPKVLQAPGFDPRYVNQAHPLFDNGL
jgi:hypothetical protein